MIENILRENNYSCTTETRPAYRGASAQVTVRRVAKNGFTGYAREVSGPELSHLQRIKNVQTSIPHVAPIHEITAGVIISKEAVGELVWEMETAPDHLDKIKAALAETRNELERQNLVHADIRPWNIMFDEATNQTTLFRLGLQLFRG
jgi:RIO-like serine/threonine protein kinase